MQCPFCSERRNKVVDSRESKEGIAIRRRRECLSCHRRFTTYERVEEIPYMVVKKGREREPFDRSRILTGLLKSCEKRPVARHQLEQLADEVEGRLLTMPEREMTSEEIGQFLMKRLKQIDKIAYVRFASVCLEFKDVRDFAKEIEHLLKPGK